MTVSKDILRKEINNALDNAEKIWNNVGTQFINENLVKAFSDSRSIPTKIPGYPFLDEGKPEVGQFIALILDIRNSTEHLLQSISGRKAKASQLERVLYETSAINTAGAIIVENNGGGITEFLGDGFLALFKVKDEKNPIEVYSAHETANYFLTTALFEINSILSNRYSLPELQIGIGLAYSKAIVTLVGHGDNIHPKAIGECIYRASKLSKEINIMLIDDKLERLWPTGKNGRLRFTRTTRIKEFKAFEISKNN